MLLNHMEGEAVTNAGLISSIKNFNIEGKQHGTIKTILRNFILPESEMAIKQNQKDKCVYTVPVKLPLPTMTDRRKSMNEAKLAFLNSTVNPPSKYPHKRQEETTIHYAQIAITTGSDDTRSTGGGKDRKEHIFDSKKSLPVNISPSIRNKFEPHQRKVSFKTKGASVCFRRPPIATKTMTITSTKVSELTKKFNNLQNESLDGVPPKLVKTFEDLATASRCSASNSSTPSSTLSSSPNIKIVLRQKRGSKKRNNRKRCSSMDSIDKLVLKDNTSAKIHVIRSKSDGTKIPKTSKKRLKYCDSSEQQSGSDSVDGSPAKLKGTETKEQTKPPETLKVKNVIKKFECEIIAHSNNTLKRQPDRPKSTTPIKEKPKVPEKKSSIVLTKNVVVKDGVPKIRTIKPPTVESVSKQVVLKSNPTVEPTKKKDPIYDRKKYKTNYIHTEKMPLKVVEIIPEDINESATSNPSEQNVSISEPKCNISSEANTDLEINSPITPNDSFLWRRISNSQIYTEIEKISSESPYCSVISLIGSAAENTDNQYESSNLLSEDAKKSQTDERQASLITCNESQQSKSDDNKCNSYMDFECNLVEAYNKEVLLGFTAKSTEESPEENDYEPLEPKDDNHIVIIPVKTIEGPKVNCPLPEIPKRVSPPESPEGDKNNIYQCLLEMRSHPEGDESSLHNYEVCENALEERTRGDGDSDDGYEYCKSPIKPYCRTSSSGIQIAEDYQPYSANKNYVISKSLSGTSTVSYEKIGPGRIYEKIPNQSPKSKDSSPTYSSRHSFMSDYTGYNENENIYDTIKHGDGTSLSHCYESIPNSPSMVKLRNNFKKNCNSVAQKRLSFDAVSNVSQSTMSSEQKTNSIYGQRSVISFNGQEIAFQVPSSETSVSDRSDRSDDWVDVSDEEKTDEQKIIIVRERSRGRKSPISWSQKVRHQWQKTPKKTDDKVSVTSSSNVYLDTNAKLPYYSRNDEEAKKAAERARLRKTRAEDNVRFIEVLEQKCWLSIRTVLRDADIEIQDIAAFIECDSSDSGHLYESLEPRAVPHIARDDSDSFDSDTDSEDHEQSTYAAIPPTLPASRLPTPPSGGQYTLTKIASAAQKKMKQIKRNLTKRYSVAMDGNPFKSPPSQNGTYDTVTKNTKSPIYANYEKPEIRHVYSNVNFNDNSHTAENPKGFKDELKIALGEKRFSNGDAPPLPEKNIEKVEKPVTPTSDGKKDSGTLSRKAYLSLKSRFRRATSIAVDINDVPSALKITNSTFYLTDSMDGDSGFSNCSDNAAGSSETLTVRRQGTRLRSAWAESSPCLALERPGVPPPPPPVLTPHGAPVSGASATGAHASGASAVPGATSPAGPQHHSSALSLSTTGAKLSGVSNGATLSVSNGAPLSGSPVSSPNGATRSPAAQYAATGAPLVTLPSGRTSPLSRTSTDLSAVNEELKRLLPTLSRKDKAPRARTSWYAECGSDVVTSQQSNTSWYAEVGLYQAGNVSTSSGASSGSHPASPLPHSLFTHEPLYQFYNAAKVESVCRETGDSDSDAYEASPQPLAPPPARPSAMALVAPRGPARTLWCEVPEVLHSALLSSLAPAQKRLQEAKFELLTSEASYLNSLNVLEAHFIAHPAFREPHILPRADWETLFSTILPVRKCSQLLMNELEKCWQESILLQGICDIVRQHAEEHFHVYVKYCENQALMVKTLQRLRERPAFANALKRMESHPACQALSLHSFLMLPMQRVTRLPLLLDAVLRHLPAHADEYQPCMHALSTLNNFVSQCNEGARNTERVEEMFRLAHSIEFPPHVKRAPELGPACARRDRKPVRWLVRSGEMTQLVWKTDEMKLTFGKKFHKVPLYLFLFNDLLVITKKKSEELYVAVDHCPRSLLEVSASEGGAASAKHALLLTLLENHDGRTVEMLMSCPSETDASRWSEALAWGGGSSASGEAVYAGWDCPQVCALYAYAPAQPDELPLAEGDVINVTRKTSEGWYYGERTRDGEAGWFPGAYTAEIASAHVRARNLRQRYRLLALSGTYVGQKKRL